VAAQKFVDKSPLPLFSKEGFKPLINSPFEKREI
jgi:hypothetical protein